MQVNIKDKVQANRMIFVLLKWRPFVKKNARNKFIALLATRYPLFMYKRGLTVLLHHRLVVWKGLYQIRKWVLCVFWQTSVFKISIIYFLLAASQLFLWFFSPKIFAWNIESLNRWEMIVCQVVTFRQTGKDLISWEVLKHEFSRLLATA